MESGISHVSPPDSLREKRFWERLSFESYLGRGGDIGQGLEFPLFHIGKLREEFSGVFKVASYRYEFPFVYDQGKKVTIAIEAKPLVASGWGFTPFSPISDDDQSYRALYYPSETPKALGHYNAYVKKLLTGESGSREHPVIDLSGAIAPLSLSIDVDEHFSDLEQYALGVYWPGTRARFVLPSLTETKATALMGGHYSIFVDGTDSQTYLQALGERKRRGGIFLPADVNALGYARGFIVQNERVRRESLTQTH